MSEKIPIPAFSGERGLDAKTFVSRIEKYASVQQLNDKQAADAAMFALEGKALRWAQNRREEGDGILEKWSEFQKAILKRFSPTPSYAEQRKLIEGLRQGREENVEDFYDRCEATQYILDEDLTTEVRQGANFKTIHETAVRRIFVQGLRSELREEVEKDTSATTLADLKTKARAAEAACVNNEQNRVDELTRQLAEMNAQLMAIQKRSQREERRPSWRGRGSRMRGACFRCGKMGHWRDRCQEQVDGRDFGGVREDPYGNNYYNGVYYPGNNNRSLNF